MTDAAAVAAIDPSHAILLVMDYQPGILGNLPNGDEMVARAADAIAIARAAGAHVGYVRVAFEASDYASVPVTNLSFSRVRGGGAFRSDAPETQVHERVAPEPGDIVVRKTRVGAFSTTNLDRLVRGRGIDTLILAGISTSGVVLSTVRDAADRDYRIFVLADACADTDAEVHTVLTTKVFPRQAHVITISELGGVLGAM